MHCDTATIQRLQAEEIRCHDMLEAFYWAESESEYNKQLQVRRHAGGGRVRRAWPARPCGSPASASLRKPHTPPASVVCTPTLRPGWQEYYTVQALRQQHQQVQQRLNQVLYGHTFSGLPQHAAPVSHPSMPPLLQQQHGYNPQQQQQYQQPDVEMAAVAACLREPLQPLAQPWQQLQQQAPGAAAHKAGVWCMDAAHVPLIGRKRSSEAGEFGAGGCLRCGQSQSLCSALWVCRPHVLARMLHVSALKILGNAAPISSYACPARHILTAYRLCLAGKRMR